MPEGESQAGWEKPNPSGGPHGRKEKGNEGFEVEVQAA